MAYGRGSPSGFRHIPLAALQGGYTNSLRGGVRKLSRMSAVPHRVEKCDRKKLSQGGMLTDVATRSTIRVKGETSVSCQLVDRLHDGKNCGHSISCRADTPPPTFDGDLPLRGELERAAASDFIPQPARADGA